MLGLYPWWSLSVKVHPDTGRERAGNVLGVAHGVKEVGTFKSLWPHSLIPAARALRRSFLFLSTSVRFLSSSRFSQDDDIEPLMYSIPWEFHPGFLRKPSQSLPHTGALPLLLS